MSDVYLIPKRRTNVRLGGYNLHGGPSLIFLLELNPEQTWTIADYTGLSILGYYYAIHMSGDKSAISPYVSISHICTLFDVYIDGEQIDENIKQDDLAKRLDEATEEKYKLEAEKYNL